DDVLDLKNLAAHVHGNFLGQVAAGDGGRHLGHVPQLHGQVVGHAVDAIGQILPRTGDAPHLGLAAEFSFSAHLARHTGHFGGEGVQLVHHGVDGVFQFEDFALDVHRDFFGQVAVGHGGGHVGDVTHLGRQVAGHGVDRVGEVLPGAGHALDARLTAEFA